MEEGCQFWNLWREEWGSYQGEVQQKFGKFQQFYLRVRTLYWSIWRVFIRKEFLFTYIPVGEGPGLSDFEIRIKIESKLNL
jgi:hypothetical protein